LDKNKLNCISIYNLKKTFFFIVKMYWLIGLGVLVVAIVIYRQCQKRELNQENHNVYEESLITYQIEKQKRFAGFKEILVEKEECCICMEEINENVYDLPCSHIFHERCLELWAEKNYDCPYCRQNILEHH